MLIPPKSQLFAFDVSEWKELTNYSHQLLRSASIEAKDHHELAQHPGPLHKPGKKPRHPVGSVSSPQLMHHRPLRITEKATRGCIPSCVLRMLLALPVRLIPSCPSKALVSELALRASPCRPPRWVCCARKRHIQQRKEVQTPVFGDCRQARTERRRKYWSSHALLGPPRSGEAELAQRVAPESGPTRDDG